MSTAEPAGGRQRPARADLLTIGEVLAELREDFPDTTHSKVRFLEERGLVTPARTPSGYRKFSREHLARLRLVLTLQRDRYLPLKVIAEHLAALDAGQQPHLPATQPAAAPADAPAAAAPPAAAPPAPPADQRREPPRTGSPVSSPAAARTPAPAPTPPRAPDAPATPPGAPVSTAPPAPLSPAEVVALAGGDAALVSALGDHGLLPPAHAGGATDAVVRAAATLASFGIEPRHLRALRTAAEREAALIEAVAAPLRRTRTAGAQRDAAALAGEQIEGAFASLRAGLLRAALTSPR